MMIISNQQLHSLITDIENQQRASPAFALFNAQKIQNLFSKNAILINTMKEFLVKIMMEFAKKDEKGNVMTTISPENGHTELAFENELDKKAYLDAYREFASKTFQLNM